MKALLPAAFAAVMLPMAAAATTIMPGDTIGNFLSLSPNATASFSYEPSKTVTISVVSVSGSGFSGGSDLMKVLFGIDGATSHFVSVNNNGATSSGTGTLASFTTGTPFTVDFSAPGTSKQVVLGYTFAVSAVPVPASGLLLLGALGVAAAALRRRHHKAA